MDVVPSGHFRKAESHVIYHHMRKSTVIIGMYRKVSSALASYVLLSLVDCTRFATCDGRIEAKV